MEEPSLRTFLRLLPKAEHHVHLEGCLTPSLIFTFAARNGVPLPTTTHPAFGSMALLTARFEQRYSSLDDFLGYYDAAMTVLRTANDFQELAEVYLQHARAAAVQHVDLSFDIQAHLSRGIELETILTGLERACKPFAALQDLSSTLICCFQRHRPVASALETYILIRPHLSSGRLGGIGLDSSEKGFPPALFADVFAQARADHVRCTAHAGEERGPEAIRETLELLHTSRIDHGRTLPQDPALLEEVARRQVLVTLCPLSYVALGGVADVQQVPIPAFLAAGVSFSVNSDDPAFFGGNWIGENYDAVDQAFHLSKEQWYGIARAGIEGAWCDERRKKELRHKLKKFEKHEGLDAAGDSTQLEENEDRLVQDYEGEW